MIILGIETSCDETALSIIETTDKDDLTRLKVLANTVHSQIDIHKQYGGVFPALAKREHARNLVPLLEKVLNESDLLKAKTENDLVSSKTTGIEKTLVREPELLKAFVDFIPRIGKPPIDLISVTYGPGLEPALWVGINFAKALSDFWNIPLVGANHMEGHIVSALLNEDHDLDRELKKFEFPALALLISGGHTEIVHMKKWRDYEVIGESKDDAVGEAYDKVARILGLPYPGGPEISKLAEKVRSSHNSSRFKLPRPMIHTEDFDFSFSGLKTAVLYAVKKIEKVDDSIKEEIAFEFENAVEEVLITKTTKALEKTGAKTLIIGGGVIANKNIRRSFEEISKQQPSLSLLIADNKVTTDNALMIALAGYFKHNDNKFSTSGEEITAKGNLGF